MRNFLILIAMTLAVAIGPLFLVLGTGYVFPELVPWKIAELALKAGAIASLVLGVFLLFKPKLSTSFKFLFSIITLAVGFLGLTGEIIMQKECGSPRGELINFQRQFAEDNAASSCL